MGHPGRPTAGRLKEGNRWPYRSGRRAGRGGTRGERGGRGPLPPTASARSVISPSFPTGYAGTAGTTGAGRRGRLRSSRARGRSSPLERALGIKFRNRDIRQTALTHRSYAFEQSTEPTN